jgi:hypothetical protein
VKAEENRQDQKKKEEEDRVKHFSAYAQVRDDDAGEGAGEVRRAPGGESAREVRVVAAVVVAHVHAAVEHDALPADGGHHAALPHLLPRPCTRSPARAASVRV